MGTSNKCLHFSKRSVSFLNRHELPVTSEKNMIHKISCDELCPLIKRAQQRNRECSEGKSFLTQARARLDFWFSQLLFT